ncbi:MAG: hypothetical protein ACRCUF_16750 [Aeromonas sobria]
MELRGNRGPFPCAKLLEIINAQRATPVAPQNLRQGLKTMAEHGMVNQFRHPTKLTLAYTLTDEGRAHAEVIYSDRTQGDENEQA